MNLMSATRQLLVSGLTCLALDAFAQSCVTPVEITNTGAFAGNTCISSNQLPYIANGAIATQGKQDIYHVHVVDGTGVTFNLTPEASVDLGLAVCRNQCSTYATCTSVVDSGVPGATQVAPLPDGPGDYYIIIGGGSTCGNYNLYVAAPLGKVN